MSTSFPFNHMRVRFAGETDVGKTRDHNEDAFYLPVEERFAIVADGMGRHASGEVASQLAVETIVEHFQRTAEDQDVTWPYKMGHGRMSENRLVVSIMLANQKIYEQAQANPAYKGMGTTVVSVLFEEDFALLAHVGDSRIYRLRPAEIVQLTQDHSFLNEYARMKGITVAEAQSMLRQKNVISRALGMKPMVKVDVVRVNPSLGDVYLLCTDGLTDMISDEAIHRIVFSEEKLDKVCDMLIDAANEAGGKDNITVVLARIEPQD